MPSLGELKRRKKRQEERLAAARGVGGAETNDALVKKVKKNLRDTKRRISERRGLPKELGREFGERVQKKPWKFDDIKDEVTEALTPFHEEETGEQELRGFTRPGEDYTREEFRGGEDVSRSRERLAAELASAREFRDITEGQERQGFNRDVGSRNISSSPAADRLRERLERIQAARTEAQERGFTEGGQDIDRGELRFGEDLSRGRTRLEEDRQRFLKQRRQNLQELIGQETEATVFRNKQRIGG